MDQLHAPEPVATVVIARTDEIEQQTTATTPAGMPDVKVKPMPAWLAIIVRATRVFLQPLVTGWAGSGVAGGSVPSGAALRTLLLVSACGALGSAAQNSLEILARLDSRFPQFRA